MNPHKCGFQETEEWKDGPSNHIHCIRFWLLLLLSHVQNEDKHLTRQMMENSKYLTTKTYSLNKLIQEYKWRGRAIGPNSQHPHPPKQASLITWSYYFSQLEGLRVPGVTKDGSWKKTKPSGSFAGSWMIIRVPQICPRDAISAGLNQGCQREPCELPTAPGQAVPSRHLHVHLAFRNKRHPGWVYNPLQGWQLSFLQFESRSHQEGATGCPRKLPGPDTSLPHLEGKLQNT